MHLSFRSAFRRVTAVTVDFRLSRQEPAVASTASRKGGSASDTGEAQRGDCIMESAAESAMAREGQLGHVFRFLEEHEVYRLEALYCALDAPGRRRRFCAAVSDASIRVHCEGLARKGAVVIGAFQSGRMDAAVEILPVSEIWDEAEIAVTSFRRDGGALAMRLLELAAREGRRRGCDRFMTVLEAADAALMPALARLGDVEIESEIARIDISDAASFGLSREPSSFAAAVAAQAGPRARDAKHAN
jgi:hypothetical protein